jgi:hypothetical protein
MYTQQPLTATTNQQSNLYSLNNKSAASASVAISSSAASVPPPTGYSMHTPTVAGFGFGPTHFTPAPPPSSLSSPVVVTGNVVDWPALPSSPLVNAPTSSTSPSDKAGKISPVSLTPMLIAGAPSIASVVAAAERATTVELETKDSFPSLTTTDAAPAVTGIAGTVAVPTSNNDNQPVVGPTRALYLGNIRGEQTTCTYTHAACQRSQRLRPPSRSTRTTRT